MANTNRIVQIFFLPGATVFAAEVTKKEECVRLVRPSELPFYTPEKAPLPAEPPKEIPSYIEENIAAARQQVSKLLTEVKAYQRVGLDYLEQGRDNAEWLIKYLRQEDNTTPKAGAIAIGGLTGLIFGLRGGLFKRTLYATTGALGMASICYPKEASEYSQIAIGEARKYATIAYNFAYGVKKDDPPLELPSLPHFPSSLSEAWGSVSKSAHNLVSGEESEQAAGPTKQT